MPKNVDVANIRKRKQENILIKIKCLVKNQTYVRVQSQKAIHHSWLVFPDLYKYVYVYLGSFEKYVDLLLNFCCRQNSSKMILNYNKKGEST